MEVSGFNTRWKEKVNDDTKKKYRVYFVYVSKIKMEGESVDAGGENHLKNVLSQTEIANIPNPIAVKINNYIDQKFGEYLTSKALHETSKSQIGKYPVFSATHSKLSSRILSFFTAFTQTTYGLA